MRHGTYSPDPRWLAKVQASRDNDLAAPAQEEIMRLCWREGLGPVATARIIDWYATSHPSTIERQRTDG